MQIGEIRVQIGEIRVQIGERRERERGGERGRGAQLRIRLGDPVILSRTGTRTQGTGTRLILSCGGREGGERVEVKVLRGGCCSIL